ncbi:hypothetical protein Ahy_B08g094088 [Arachis hypogaea]|uniref:Uncharacterized protein n=1 Tax=Arachis hypogaea TaxID=3818 RepID=A0A444Y7U6_ARAHY|nr:hypothetical protein Ahy_B08g094088 [Arachis hypogaea]
MPEEELGYLGSLGVKQIDGTPRPHFDLKVKTSVYDKPIKAVALMDTGSCATVVKPHVLPKEMWAPFSKKFAAANSESSGRVPSPSEKDESEARLTALKSVSGSWRYGSYGSDFGPSASSGIPASILVGLGGKAYTLPPGSSEFRSSPEYLLGACVDVLGRLPKLTKGRQSPDIPHHFLWYRSLDYWYSAKRGIHIKVLWIWMYLGYDPRYPSSSSGILVPLGILVVMEAIDDMRLGYSRFAFVHLNLSKLSLDLIQFSVLLLEFWAKVAIVNVGLEFLIKLKSLCRKSIFEFSHLFCHRT